MCATVQRGVPMDHGKPWKIQVHYSIALLFQRFARTVKYSNPNPNIIRIANLQIAANWNSGLTPFRETMHHRCVAAQHCINGDSLSQWRRAKFHPPENGDH